MKQENTNAICPICMKDNACAMESNENNQNKQSCWCMSVEIPTALLDQIPDNKKGKSCICRSCLKKF